MTVYVVMSLPKTPYIHRINACMYAFGQPYKYVFCIIDVGRWALVSMCVACCAGSIVSVAVVAK